MLHNHPGQLGFSLNDLVLFINVDSIKTITIVTNYGHTKYLTKSKKYYQKSAVNLYRQMFNHLDNDVDKKVVGKYIKKLYDLGIIRER